MNKIAKNVINKLFYNKLKISGIRCELNNKPDKIGAKIRDSELSKINIMLILGEEEYKNQTITVRRKLEKRQEVMTFSELNQSLINEIKERRKYLDFPMYL